MPGVSTRVQEDRELVILMTTLEVRLQDHERQMLRVNEHIFFGNGKASLDVQLSKVLDAVQRLTERQDEWRRWFWGLTGSVLVSLLVSIVVWWGTRH